MIIYKGWSKSIYIVQEFCSNSRSVVSVSTLHLHIGSTVSLKLCLNLCSFKWLKFNLRRVSSLRALVLQKRSSLESNKTEDCFFKFITNTVFRIFSLSAHHSLIGVWVKRRIKSFGSSRESLHLVLTYWPCLVLAITIMI